MHPAKMLPTFAAFAERSVRFSMAWASRGCLALSVIGATFLLTDNAPTLREYLTPLLLLGVIAAGVMILPLALVVFVSCLLIGAWSIADSGFAALEHLLSWAFLSPGISLEPPTLTVSYALPALWGFVCFGLIIGGILRVPVCVSKSGFSTRLPYIVVGLVVSLALATAWFAGSLVLDPIGIGPTKRSVNPYEFFLGNSLGWPYGFLSETVARIFGSLPWLLLLWLAAWAGTLLPRAASKLEVSTRNEAQQSNT